MDNIEKINSKSAKNYNNGKHRLAHFKFKKLKMNQSNDGFVNQ